MTIRRSKTRVDECEGDDGPARDIAFEAAAPSAQDAIKLARQVLGYTGQARFGNAAKAARKLIDVLGWLEATKDRINIR